MAFVRYGFIGHSLHQFGCDVISKVFNNPIKTRIAMLFIFNLLPYSASPPGIYLNEHIKIYGFNLRDFFQSSFWIMVNQNVSRKKSPIDSNLSVHVFIDYSLNFVILRHFFHSLSTIFSHSRWTLSKLVLESNLFVITAHFVVNGNSISSKVCSCFFVFVESICNQHSSLSVETIVRGVLVFKSGAFCKWFKFFFLQQNMRYADGKSRRNLMWFIWTLNFGDKLPI